MSAVYTKLVFKKWANIGAIVWATVSNINEREGSCLWWKLKKVIIMNWRAHETAIMIRSDKDQGAWEKSEKGQQKKRSSTMELDMRIRMLAWMECEWIHWSKQQ